MKTYTIKGENNLPESELEIEVEVSSESFSKHRNIALKKLSETISVPGFRQGHVPENIVIQKVGEPYLLEEAAYSAIEKNLPEIKILRQSSSTFEKLAQSGRSGKEEESTVS